MNAYHNLAGWLRDVRAAMADAKGANLNPMSGAYTGQVYDLLVELKDMFDDGDLEATMESAVVPDDEGDDELIDDGDDEVADRQPRVGRTSRPQRRAVGGGRTDLVGRSADVADAIPPAVQETGRRRSRQPAPVARAGKRGVARGKK